MIRAIVVDDEPPARAKLLHLLQAEKDFVVVAEAADGEDAIGRILDEKPDVVFLDIQMPRLDGFGVIEAIGVDDMPLVVFVTAYDEHALRAFDVHALDYLLKPFAPTRFRRVLERVRRHLDRDTAGLSRRLEAVLAAAAQHPSHRYLTRLLATRGHDREVLVPVERIDVFRAEGNYVRLIASDGEYLRRATLSSLAERLDPEKFFRINRSEIVRCDAIRELNPWFHGDYRIKLQNGQMLNWSRRYRSKLPDGF